jgi:phosphoglycerate dehydrogenase-like enzyme
VSWNIVITARVVKEVGQPAIELLRRAGCEVVIPPKLGALRAEELQAVHGGADGVLASADQYSRAVLTSPAAARLKIVSRWGVGYDSIDVAAATELGIVIAYTPGLLNETVADYTFALLLTLVRRVHVVDAAVRQGVWKPVWGHDIAGKTLGVIGCGRIGQAVARRGSGFNLRVLGYDVAPDPRAEPCGLRFVSLDRLLSESDFVTLNAALTPHNRGLVGEAQLRRMKPTAYLVNSARGALVDEAALIRALREGWIAGAALDTFLEEPLPMEHPFRQTPNLLLSPHQASFGRETGERVSICAAQAIVDLLEGRRPQLVVNPEVFQTAALRAALP